MPGDRSHGARAVGGTLAPVFLISTALLTATALGGGGALAGVTAPSQSPGDPTQPPVAQYLDPAFGVQGMTTTRGFGGDRSAMALQTDGRIVMVGGTFVDFVLGRFGPDGQPDTTFGDGGFVTTDMVPDQQEESLAVAIAPDGGIVVAGYVGFDATFAIARYGSDGSLDASFGAGGKVVGGVPGRAYALAVQPDGKIVAAGEAVVSDSATDYADFRLARYLPDGTLDPTFGDGGQVTTDLADGTNTARNIVLLPDGGIVVSGEGYGDFEGKSTDVARYGPDGRLDPGFGTDGVLTLPGAFLGEGLALQPDGALVLVGVAGEHGSTTFAVMRLGADGSLDETFGDAGMVLTDVADQGDAANAVAIASDGRIVVAGRSGDINTDFGVVRYLPDGSVDPTFANAGTLTVDFAFLPDIAESVAIQPDGMTVVGGFVQQEVDGWGLVRVLP